VLRDYLVLRDFVVLKDFKLHLVCVFQTSTAVQFGTPFVCNVALRDYVVAVRRF
jgi:hypothetical protein